MYQLDQYHKIAYLSCASLAQINFQNPRYNDIKSLFLRADVDAQLFCPCYSFIILWRRQYCISEFC